MEDLQKQFKKVKAIEWDKAIVSFYVVQRRLVRREAKYAVLHVNVDEPLRKKIRKVAFTKMDNARQAIEYDFNTSDLDQNFLGISSDETDFEDILGSINDLDKIKTAESYEALVKSWIYVARLQVDDQTLYAVRQISNGWTTKKVFQSISMVFIDNMLVNLDQKEIFRVDNKIDFFSFNGTIFIADKSNFESALNFRLGMEKNRDEIVEAFKEINLFVDAEEIKTLVGNNIKRLRKLSQVKKAGYYLDESFLKSLKEVNEEEKWGIKYSDDGKLIVSEDDIETVLKLLNNDRLTSKINKEDFDVDVKHKLEN